MERTAEDIVKQAKQMREHQKEYFKKRTTTSLEASIKSEKALDKMIEEYEQKQNILFD